LTTLALQQKLSMLWPSLHNWYITPRAGQGPVTRPNPKKPGKKTRAEWV
jgi:hypothetical protein